MNLNNIFQNLWNLYKKNNSQAAKIHRLLKEQGEIVQNDHIAFRTFQHPSIGIHAMAKLFLDRGYEVGGDYYFEKKKLNAIHLVPPTREYPLIFLSELITSEFSQELQNTINGLIDQVYLTPSLSHFLWSQNQWEMIDYLTYQSLLEESEYAAWTATFGFQANHFTILINALKNYDIRSLNSYLKSEGFALNSSGGEIKGSEDSFLEQSSTLAAEIEVEFADRKAIVPCCYYEFAQRYSLPNGELFQGFVTQSADKIFESTHSR